MGFDMWMLGPLLLISKREAESAPLKRSGVRKVGHFTQILAE
jgi:hypothetical protein